MFKVGSELVVARLSLVLCLFLGGCIGSQLQKEDPTLPPGDKVENWHQAYYKQPRPELFYASLDLVNLQNETRLYSAIPGMIGFYGELFLQHPGRINEWVARVESWNLKAPTEFILWGGLRFSGTVEGEEILRLRSGKAVGKRAEALRWALSKSPDEYIGKDKIRAPESLDLLWGKFFASGNRTHVIRIMTALESAPDPASPDKTTLSSAQLTGMAALWSLLANSRQDPEVLNICREELAHEQTGSTIAQRLNFIVQQAEKDLQKR